jgi:hypothetical protein
MTNRLVMNNPEIIINKNKYCLTCSESGDFEIETNLDLCLSFQNRKNHYLTPIASVYSLYS